MSDVEVRLIDANSFKRFLQALCKAGAPYEEVIQLLDKEPTAFDAKNVVKELWELYDLYEFASDKQPIIVQTVEIVGRGWVE
jgi:hypothetical protein